MWTKHGILLVAALPCTLPAVEVTNESLVRAFLASGMAERHCVCGRAYFTRDESQVMCPVCQPPGTPPSAA